MRILIFFLVIVVRSCLVSSDYCYSTDTVRPQTLLLNTKTAYQRIKSTDPIEHPANCTPTKFWLFSRHGTRLPSAGSILKLPKLIKIQSEIIKNYNEEGNRPIEDALCPEDLQLLKEWKWDTNITVDKNDWLTIQGWNDLKGIAQFYKANFPTLLSAYYPSKFIFRHSATQRTQASYKAFVDGLLGEGANEFIPAPVVPKRDTLIRPYDYCVAWQRRKDDMEAPDSELSKFKASELYQNMVKEINRKAGYKTEFPLGTKDIEKMHEMCEYETAWNLDADSPWCSMLNLDQMKIIEYAGDIKDWYENGAGSEYNSRITCELAQDILAKLNTPTGPSVIAYFGHDTTFQLFLTSLGVASDDIPFLADNYEKMANRSFRTSKISPFATNLAVIRYECGDEVKIQFLINQRPLQLEGCSNGLCPLAELNQRLAKFKAVKCSTYFCPKDISVKLLLGTLFNLLGNL